MVSIDGFRAVPWAYYSKMELRMDHYRKLERMYLNANINKQIFDTTTVNISEGKAEIGLKISGKFFHAQHAVHGSVYFKLLDDAAFFAANSVVTDVFVLTTSFSINLVKPVSEGLLTARGKLKFRSKNLFVAESSLLDEKGNEIAFGTGTFMRSRAELNESIGYK